MAPRPAAVIGLRDAQTGTARATRVRQLATPSWLSTRPKPVIQRRAAPDRDARETVARTASSTWSSLLRPEVLGFLACAPGRCAMTQDDVAANPSALDRTTQVAID